MKGNYNMLSDQWKNFHKKEKINTILENKSGGWNKYNAQNYLERFNYVCSDFDKIYNKFIENFSSITLSDVICAVVFMDWAIEAVDMIENELSFMLNIKFNSDNKYKKLHEFSDAMRSFIIAHPLETNRHKKYNLDGKYICIDIQPQGNPFVIDGYKHFSLSGLQNKPSSNKKYVYIKCYSANIYNRKTQQFNSIKYPNKLYYFGISLDDIYTVISYCIKRLDYFNRTIKKII